MFLLKTLTVTIKTLLFLITLHTHTLGLYVEKYHTQLHQCFISIKYSLQITEKWKIGQISEVSHIFLKFFFSSYFMYFGL